jgi:hypothetical protein
MVLAYLDRTDRIREVAEQSILPKMGAQIADDGSLPQERNGRSPCIIQLSLSKL